METIAPGIRQLDTLLGGHDHMTAGFVIEGPQPALIETGSQTSVPEVEAALHSIGLYGTDLRWIVVTHIHLDHAGGVGDLARSFPRATIVVHEKGAQHLVDPTRLIDSAARVYGRFLDELYGRMIAVPEDRVISAGDGFTLDIGNGRTLTIVDSPGHAKHHQAVLDDQTGTLLVGDAVGVKLPDVGVLRPATPPPDFDFELAVSSLRRFAELRPTQVVLTHYGPVGPPDDVLNEAEDMLHRWMDVAERALAVTPEASLDDVATALADIFATPPHQLPESVVDKFEMLNGIHSNAAGIVRYLAKRNQATSA